MACFVQTVITVKKPEVTYIMNYLVNNFNQCESQVLRIQPYLIQLCGTVNSICCNGAVYTAISNNNTRIYVRSK